jgi:ATP-dependent protease ClpP protease subunit
MSTTTHPWYNIRRRTAVAAAALGIAAAGAAEIYIYGDIGENWWAPESVTAAKFVQELNALDATAITVRVNSVGGSAADGIAIQNALKRHPATITVCVDALAASIAAFITTAGDVVEMAENTLMMVHGGHTGVYGNATELRTAADMLDAWNRAMATSFATKSARPYEEMLALLTDGQDHWYTAEQALEAKLIDQIAPAIPVTASLMRDLPLERFTSAPEWVQAKFKPGNPAPAAIPAAPPAVAATLPANPAKGPTMTEEEKKAFEAKVRAEALAADVIRRTEIREALQPLRAMRPELTADLDTLQGEADVNAALDVATVKARALDVLAKGATPAAGGYIATLEDEADKQRSGVQAALMIRANLTKNDTANPFRGYSLSEIARASLERCGVKTGAMDKMSLVAAAFTHSTSDFSKLLANVAEKSMMKGFEEAGETFQLWTTKGTLSDFKAASRVDLNTFPSLDLVPEGGEYKYGTIGDRGETIQLATYGKLFSITRQAVINDDLNSMAKVPRLMGRAAIRTVGNLVYAILTSNPTMSDGVALFHANHGNLAAAGAAINTATVDAMRVLMGLQKDGNAVLNLNLAYLLVPKAMEGTANVTRNSEFEVGASSRNNTTPNTVRNTFEVISDARLDAASAPAWYGAGNAGITDTIEVAYLDGNDTPTLEEQSGWTVDGVEMKVRLDAGVKALSYRALAKNPGA